MPGTSVVDPTEHGDILDAELELPPSSHVATRQIKLVLSQTTSSRWRVWLRNPRANIWLSQVELSRDFGGPGSIPQLGRQYCICFVIAFRTTVHAGN